jgi:hypothetical protein
MEFGDLSETSTLGLSGRWNRLLTLEVAPTQDLDSPWKSGHNPFRHFSPTFETQAIQPTQLHGSLWRSYSLGSERAPSASTSTSRTSASSSMDSTDGAAPPKSEYRPRGPTGKRKGATRRITPRSEKHAHELLRNRTAATKYRNRQKVYVDGLQQKCKDAEMKRQLTMSMVQSLRDELFGMRRELLRHTNCGDLKARDLSFGIETSL